MWFALLCDLVTGVELVVLAFEVEEFVMPTTLDDPAMVQHHDVVGVLDGREPVGDHESRAALHKGIHAFLDQLLSPGVDR